MSDTEVLRNPIEDLISHSLNQDYNKANEIFGNILGQKLDVALEQEKINIANSMYNGGDDEEDDGQLDLDLDGDDEETSGESSEDQDPDEEDAGADDETEDGFEEEEEDEE